MNPLDRETFGMLWRTSSREARRRYEMGDRLGLPAYDAPPSSPNPRAWVARCGSPRCGQPFMVEDRAGLKAYCCDACRCTAWYWRRKQQRSVA